ncbi:MAG: 1-deoxy-D-xylulose-5-phosphate synthase [Chloroflexota bacterium]|jgi:1-deoxy-D-xylulose-5-phosphate synthase|nr:1-deoxy-D-xylulose-5-phosphate synthase [Chloroflexota bacterium]
MERLLEQINSPADLRRLDRAQLDQLADEIREFLIQKVSENGGHLSPNLGVVEMTLAMHRVFDSPRDAIVWDTGHQSYVHKLVTGRREEFSTLRQEGGMSGYPSRAESEHDVIENSHASTSLSYALGIAEARLRKGIEGHVIAVIGDGALTGGMAYEALNQIAHLKPSNLLIVLNDNGRSYAPTVGGIASHLSQLAISPGYERFKQRISQGLQGIPVVGGHADQAAFRLKESVKQLVAPTTVFDSLGLKYAGPVDGHDIAQLEDVLQRSRLLGEPVVVHVVTEKGRGYGPAMGDEIEKLHAVPISDPRTGQPLKTELTYTNVFSEALLSAGARYPELVAITAAMPSPTGLLDFGREFPERFFDVGICEQHAVTFAAGLALAGMHPVVAIYSTFMQRAFDQALLDVCMHNLPVTFILDRAGVTGPDGSSHHGVFDMTLMRAMPNLVVAAPADATELCALLETAVALDGPMAIRFPKGAAPSTPDLPVEALPVGRWEEVRRGREVCFLAIGRMVGVALEAAAILEREGIDAGVVNCRWLKPIDPRLVSDWAERYPTLVTAEDNVMSGGFGAAVLETLAPFGLAGKVRVKALPDRFLPHGRPLDILAENGLDPAGLASAARDAVRAASTTAGPS